MIFKTTTNNNGLQIRLHCCLRLSLRYFQFLELSTQILSAKCCSYLLFWRSLSLNRTRGRWLRCCATILLQDNDFWDVSPMKLHRSASWGRCKRLSPFHGWLPSLLAIGQTLLMLYQLLWKGESVTTCTSADDVRSLRSSSKEHLLLI